MSDGGVTPGEVQQQCSCAGRGSSVATRQEDLLGRLITCGPNIFTSNCILNNFGRTGNVKDPLKFTVK